MIYKNYSVLENWYKLTSIQRRLIPFNEHEAAGKFLLKSEFTNKVYLCVFRTNPKWSTFVFVFLMPLTGRFFLPPCIKILVRLILS